MSRRLAVSTLRLAGAVLLAVAAVTILRVVWTAANGGCDNFSYTLLDNAHLLLTFPGGKTTVITLSRKDDGANGTQAVATDCPRIVPNAAEAMPFYSLRSAPSLVWKSGFEEWNASAGAKRMQLAWQGSTAEAKPKGLPSKLMLDKVHYIQIRAKGVFSAYLKGESSIIPVFIRPAESEARRVYGARSAEPVSMEWDGVSEVVEDDEGTVWRPTNRWGGHISPDSNLNGTAVPGLRKVKGRLKPSSKLNGGKGSSGVPPLLSSSVPVDVGYDMPFPESPHDGIKQWELAFFVPVTDGYGGRPYTLYIRNLEPESSIMEPWMCNLAIGNSEQGWPTWLNTSDVARDVR